MKQLTARLPGLPGLLGPPSGFRNQQGGQQITGERGGGSRAAWKLQRIFIPGIFSAQYLGQEEVQPRSASAPSDLPAICQSDRPSSCRLALDVPNLRTIMSH